MARLEDLVPGQRQTLEALDCPEFPDASLVPARKLDQCHVALISSAGLMHRKENNVPGNSAGYRTFPASTPASDILLNHISVNFDRTAFAEDINTVFPTGLLTTMADDQQIGKAAANHYSFMGATPPDKMKNEVQRLITELQEAKVNTVCLLPV